MSDKGRPTPLARAADADHPSWTDFCGWHMALQFEGIVAEHLAVRRHAGLFDISHMGRLEFRGPRATDAVERLLTRRVADMTDHAIRYSFFADPDGNILDDVMIGRWPDRWQLIVNAANRERVVAMIAEAGYADLLTDQTLATAMLALQGPESVRILDRLWPEARAATRKRYRLWEAPRSGDTLVGSRSGYTGEDGFEIYGPPAAVERLWTDLRSAGVVPCGLGSRDSLRNEAALPLYGHELREDTSPWEIGLEYAVDLGKDFIGRRVLESRKASGIRHKRVGLLLAGKRIARENMPVLIDGLPVGRTTSGTWSPLRERPIAQAMVDADAAVPGVRVEVDIRGRSEQAAVVDVRSLMPEDR